MKNPKKPTRQQKEFLSRRRVDATKFLVVEDSSEKLVLVDKETNEIKVVPR